MGRSLREAFSFSFDGSTKTAATITAPTDFYVADSPHALIKGELYIFGGETDRQKVMTFLDFEIIKFRLLNCQAVSFKNILND